MTQRWYHLYRPQRTKYIQGNNSAIDSIRVWISNLKQHLSKSKVLFSNNTKVEQSSKCLLVMGPSGVGKDLAVELLLREFQLRPLFMGWKEWFTRNQLAEMRNASANNPAFSMGDSYDVVVLQNVEAMTLAHLGNLRSLVASAHRFILVCNTSSLDKAQHAHLSAVRGLCQTVYFNSILTVPHLESVLFHLCARSGVLLRNCEVNSIARFIGIEQCQGDVRQMLLWLEHHVILHLPHKIPKHQQNNSSFPSSSFSFSCSLSSSSLLPLQNKQEKLKNQEDQEEELEETNDFNPWLSNHQKSKYKQEKSISSIATFVLGKSVASVVSQPRRKRKVSDSFNVEKAEIMTSSKYAKKKQTRVSENHQCILGSPGISNKTIVASAVSDVSDVNAQIERALFLCSNASSSFLGYIDKTSGATPKNVYQFLYQFYHPQSTAIKKIQLLEQCVGDKSFLQMNLAALFENLIIDSSFLETQGSLENFCTIDTMLGYLNQHFQLELFPHLNRLLLLLLNLTLWFTSVAPNYKANHKKQVHRNQQLGVKVNTFPEVCNIRGSGYDYAKSERDYVDPVDSQISEPRARPPLPTSPRSPSAVRLESSSLSSTTLDYVTHDLERFPSSSHYMSPFSFLSTLPTFRNLRFSEILSYLSTQTSLLLVDRVAQNAKHQQKSQFSMLPHENLAGKSRQELPVSVVAKKASCNQKLQKWTGKKVDHKFFRWRSAYAECIFACATRHKRLIAQLSSCLTINSPSFPQTQNTARNKKNLDNSLDDDDRNNTKEEEEEEEEEGSGRKFNQRCDLYQGNRQTLHIANTASKEDAFFSPLIRLSLSKQKLMGVSRRLQNQQLVTFMYDRLLLQKKTKQ